MYVDYPSHLMISSRAVIIMAKHAKHQRHRPLRLKLPRLNSDVMRYYEERAKNLNIQKTTVTPDGQILDWVPIESQVPQGQIATIPSERERTRRSNSFAVADVCSVLGEEGPEGTVPILRPRISLTADLAQFARKRKVDGRRILGVKAGKSKPPAPNLKGYYHATASQSVKCYGCDTVLSLWDPICELSGDHSLTQIGIQNYDNPKLQSIEAGCMCSQDQYGDDRLHLFTYYTTNGYDTDADGLGGYSNMYKGFVQLSRNIVPGVMIKAVNFPWFPGYELRIRFEFSNGNWVLRVGDTVVGYYPFYLFSGGPPNGKTLADHGDWCGFWGEVYSAKQDPTQTTTSMGDGLHGKYGYPWAAYQHDMEVQTAAGPTDPSITVTAEDSNMYDGMVGEKPFSKYFFFGGSGKGKPGVVVYPFPV
jgi:hypothetical protein